MRDRLILHSGPPVAWNRMCGAQRGAAIGMCLFEGWAKDAAEAERMLASGAIALEPNHHHATVGPMAGTTTSNMWVWVVENRAFGLRLSEYHTGLRAYSRRLLETIPYRLNSDDFVFDQDLIAQVVAAGGLSIGEVAVPTRYFDEASSVNLRRSVVYGLSTLRVVARYLLHRAGLRRSPKLQPRASAREVGSA